MKRFLYLMICLVSLSVGALFVLKNPNGQPWLNTSDFYNSQSISIKFTQLKNTIVDNVESLVNFKSSNEDVDSNIYQWTDELGVTHYSDRSNGKDDAWIKPNNLTVMPSLKQKESKEIDPVIDNKKINIDETKNGDVTKLITKAKNIQKLVDDRQEKVDGQLRNLN